jgi:hypothetical protein
MSDKEEERKLICPIMSQVLLNSDDKEVFSFWYCQKEDCALWYSDAQSCGLHTGIPSWMKHGNDQIY